MKSPHYTPHSRSAKFLWTAFQRVVLLSGFVAAVGAVHAADQIKANNANNLTDPASWVGGVVPTDTDVGVWDNTVAGANTTALGANTNWAGIRIANPGGLVTVTPGNTLTIGVSGIDMSAASQDLTLSNAVTLGTLQNWTIGSGRTLTLGSSLGRLANSAVRISYADGSSSVFLTNSVNSLLTNGSIVFGTVDNIDYAAVDATKKIVGGVNIAVYTNNPATATPTLQNNNTQSIVDFTVDTGGSYGFRIGNAASCWGVRVNQPNTTVPNWRIDLPSGRTLTMNAFLITPNVGNQQLQITGNGFIRIGSSGTQDLLIFQNNPAASLVFQNTGGGISQQGVGFLNKFGVGTVEIQVNGSYTGGTRIREGTLLVSLVGKIGTGPLTVFGGKFAGSSGSIIFPSSTTIFNGATNAVQVNAANGQFIVTNAVVFNAGNTYMEFNYANGIAPSTTTAPLFVVGGITNNGTLNISMNSGVLPVGQYPLIRSTNTITVGTLALIASLPHTSSFLSNNVANNTIDLVVTANNQPLRWATGNGDWNIASSSNWKDAAASTTTYQQLGSLADSVLFEDSQSGADPVVTLNTTVIPPSTVVDATKTYTISGTGTIGGIGGLIKTNSGTLILSTLNSFSGGLNINGGTLNFSALTNLGGAGINFNGGTLQFASGNVDDISVRTVTLAAGGGTIDTTVNAVNLVNPIGNNGAGGLTKTGTGTLTLNGTNRYNGNTIVSQATLALGSPTTFISNSAAIIVNGGATLDVIAGALNLSTPVSQALAGSGTVAGNVTAGASTRISPATNGVVGTLAFDSGTLTFSGGTLNLDVSTNSHDLLTVNGNITLTLGTVLVNATSELTNGVYPIATYTGALTGGAGSVGNLAVAGFSQLNKSATLSGATAGRIDLIIADTASDIITWRGTGTDWDLANGLNWLLGATPWAYTNGDFVTFDEGGSAIPNVQIMTAVLPGSVTVNNPTTTYTFVDGTGSGGGKISGAGVLTKSGAGTLVINTANNNTGGTRIDAGTVQVGDNSSTGDIGTGNVTNNGALAFLQTDNRSVVGSISGAGTVAQQGGFTLTLANNNTYSGQTEIAAGTLQIGTGGATGTLGSGPVVDNSQLTFNRSGAFSLTNAISGGGSVSTIGPATVTLVRTNTYVGNTAVTRGIVRLTAPDLVPDWTSVSATGNLVVDGGATFGGMFDLNGFNEAVNGLAGANGTVASVITNSSASVTTTNVITIGNDSVSPAATYSGLILEATNGAKIAVVKLGVGNQAFAGANNYSGGTIVGGGTFTVGAAGLAGNTSAGSGSITMSNGTTFFMAANSLTFPNNPIIIAPNSIVTFNSQVLGNQYSGLISGDANSTNIIGGPVSASGTGQWNAFPGKVLIPIGGEMRSVGVNNGGSNTTFEVHGTLHTRNADNFFIGLLEGDGTIDNPTVTPPATFLIGSKNISSTFSGNISGFNHIVKSGTAQLILNGTNVSYTGNTTVSNGILSLIVPANVSNSPIISLAGSLAVLDAKAMGYVSNELDENLIITNTFFVTNSTLALNNGQTMNGIGTVDGIVIASSGSTLRPGLPIGNLTVLSNLTLAGPIFMELNRTNATATNDMLTAPSYTVSGATLTVTNVGPDLITGDSYKLFNIPVSGLTVSLPVSNAVNTISYVWTNRIAIDGTVKVLSGATGVNTNPTNITFSASGGQLSLAWPQDHIGWRLQVQTNSINVGLSTNWVFVPNSGGTNLVIVPMSSSNIAVFYRLIYP